MIYTKYYNLKEVIKRLYNRYIKRDYIDYTKRARV